MVQHAKRPNPNQVVAISWLSSEPTLQPLQQAIKIGVSALVGNSPANASNEIRVARN